MDIETGSLGEDMQRFYEKAVKQGDIEVPEIKRLSPEEEIEKILYIRIPEVLEMARRQLSTGQWDDKYFKNYLPDYWYMATHYAYGLSSPKEAKKYWDFHEEINKKTRPYQGKPWAELDRKFMSIVEDSIKEEMERYLWEPLYYEIEAINKEFKIAGDIMREMKYGERNIMYQ